VEYEQETYQENGRKKATPATLRVAMRAGGRTRSQEKSEGKYHKSGVQIIPSLTGQVVFLDAFQAFHAWLPSFGPFLLRRPELRRTGRDKDPQHLSTEFSPDHHSSNASEDGHS
jgi:hypothetical protein